MSGVRYGEKHQRQERQSEVSLQAESFGCRIYAEYLERGRAPGPPRSILRDFDLPPHTRCGESKVSPVRYVGCNQHVILLRPRAPWLHGMRA